ncbi:hypothetical protein [Bacillus sp. FJAT-45350]|uniref:hypothetical protein n=1 Tax=Bacillus sp. FJAT-45350 TaxID=2011014 RepID=UPI000BB7A925|nr:hypothetical protein [Bacillus sp. FJAT-45350]
MKKVLQREQIELMIESFIQENLTETTDFLFHPGTIPVLVSAPHSVPQLRQGKVKQGEYTTGVLAQLLHEETNCFSLYKTKMNNDDPNFDEKNAYKDMLITIVKESNIEFLLDLHIMSSKRDYNIDIGTARGKNIFGNFSLIDDIIEVFTTFSISNVEVDKIFTAGNPNTVSSTIARECGITTIQLEINWRLLTIENGLAQFTNIYNCLLEIILMLHKKGLTND